MFQGKDKDKDKDLDFENFLKLTLAVYKVTASFPQEGRDLKTKIRESANNILAGLLSGKEVRANELLDLFQAAAEKDWVDPRNFLVLRKEYAKLQGMLFEAAPQTTGPGEALAKQRPAQPSFNNSRQKAIYGIIKERKRLQLRDLTPSFPQVSRRTLIRDLEELCHTGNVTKNGIGPGTSYIVTQAVSQ